MKFLKQFFSSLLATSTIVALVFLLLLCGVIPYDSTIFVKFLIGAGLLSLGQAIFLVSVDQSVIKMGESIGSSLMKIKKVWIIILFGFLFGMVSTIAEPDVQVLVGQLTGISSFFTTFMLLSLIGIGCGLLVSFAIFRILKNISLRWVLIVLYAIIFVLAMFCPESYLGFSFDAGGVATGSITVPFILALVIGICAIKGKNSKKDSFGAVAIASTGPIIAVLLLGVLFGEPANTISSGELTTSFVGIFKNEFLDVCLAISPLIITFIITQFSMLKLPLKQAIKIVVGLVTAGLGLIFFLTGIYFGFSEMGTFIGQNIASGINLWIIFVFGLLIGMVIVYTDPATVVLVQQIEKVTSGFLKKKLVFITIGIGVSLAILITFFHIVFKISLWYIFAPLYALMLILNFFIPKIFTAIAFDSGGIASGTMTVAFILPICMGMCTALGNDILLYGFGLAGLVATLPILTIQILGLIYNLKKKQILKKEENEIE
ncbi:MAG: DUF1538 domain-containing protein [Clostridia bacterium]|nr:DUF1538 domain-containing protein [Clostridia bacterium]